MELQDSGYYILAPNSLAYSVKIFVIHHKGDPDNVPPVCSPSTFLENLRSLRSLTYSSEKSAKNSWARENDSCAWAYQVSSPYIKVFSFSETFWQICRKKFGGRPGSPVPSLENPQKNSECWVSTSVLKATELWLPYSLIRLLRYSTVKRFGNSPLFQNW